MLTSASWVMFAGIVTMETNPEEFVLRKAKAVELGREILGKMIALTLTRMMWGL